MQQPKGMFPGKVIGTASAVAILLLTGFSARTATEPGKFIWISDLHFNPTASASLTDTLAEASVGDWQKILDSSAGRGSKFGEDTDWPLFASALAQIRRVSPHAQFTVVTGDVFVHHFRERFEKAASKHDDDAFRNFAVKTFQFVMAELGTLAPGSPVLFTLGNNDSACGDYELQPQGAFLKDTNTAVTKMLGPLADEKSEMDWPASGSYSVRHPALKNYRVISLNSVYFSPRYRNACATAGESDPAKYEMDWLANKLADASTHHEKVWLLFHIAPGIDGYSTSHPKGGGEKKIAPMWKPDYTAQFEKLLAQYHDTVMISLAGHEHMDDFRLVDHSLVLLTPALSPNVGQNPAFRVVSYQSNGALRDATTYYLSNLSDFDNGEKPDWKPEYSFDKTWAVNHLDFQNFNNLFHKVELEHELRARWATLYGVSQPGAGGITNATFPWLFCAAGSVSETNYNACVNRLQAQ